MTQFFSGGFAPDQPQLVTPIISDIPIDLNQIYVPTPPQLLDNWCSIIYYELDTPIGETFKVCFSMKSDDYSFMVQIA